MPDYAVFILRCIFFAAVHSLFAANLTKQAFKRVAGREPRSYRLLYNLASLAMFGWVMAAYRTSPLLYVAPGFWKWMLYSAQVVVAVVIFRCVRLTGAGDFLGTNSVPFSGRGAPHAGHQRMLRICAPPALSLLDPFPGSESGHDRPMAAVDTLFRDIFHNWRVDRRTSASAGVR